MNNISVLLVDDHKLFREGLKLLLENVEFINQVDEAVNGNDFLFKIKDQKYDIIFMDIEMPEKDGITATREAIATQPEINIIGLSIYGDENYYKQMINAGVKGFMIKNSGFNDVLDAINAVLSGNNYFSPEILKRLIKSFDKSSGKTADNELTKREEEVLYLICKGFSNQEIADSLFLSKRTVDKHRENLLLKTRSKNTAGLVIYAVKNNIVEI